MKIKFEIDSKQYVINEIKIWQYYEIKTALFMDEIDSKFRIISALSDCPVEVLRGLDLDGWTQIWSNFEMMVSAVAKTQLIDTFLLNGEEYGLTKIDSMTMGEFADLDVILHAPDADNKLHEVLAILYRPVTGRTRRGYYIEEYDYEGFKWRSNEFLNAPLFLAKPATAFFLHSVKSSLEAMDNFLKIKTTNPKILKLKELVKILRESGGKPSLLSQEEMLWIYQELQNLESEKLSTSSLSNMKNLKKQKSNHKNSLKNITVEDDN
jgi:hypothetical protein